MCPVVVYFFFFLSAFQPKLHLICAGRCIIGEASELIFIEFICSLNKDGGIWRIKAAWNIADYAALFFRDLLIPRLPLLFAGWAGVFCIFPFSCHSKRKW